MSDGIVFECPACGYSETAYVGPTFSISGDISATVETIQCSECGYDGEAQP